MKRFLWSFFEIAETIVIAVLAVVLIRSFVAQPFVVSGSSMLPTFLDGDYLLVDEITYRLREPERGEVIVFRYPGNNRSFYIKRIIGLPGETVSIENGIVSVENASGKKVLKETYITNRTAGTFKVELQRDQYFVMGDNRSHSFDSRSWGALDKKKIVGLVRFRLWPINEVMAFSAPEY